MKKRLFPLLMSFLLVISLTSCGDSDNPSGPIESSSTPVVGHHVSSASEPNYLTSTYLFWQYHAAEKYNMQFEANKEQEKLSSWLETSLSSGNLTASSVEYSKGLFDSISQYKLTIHEGDFYYYGETKDSYPDGFGMLTTSPDLTNLGDIRYIGSFKSGKYDGYGLLFCDPDDEDLGVFYSRCMDGKLSEEDIINYYHAFINYVVYEGEFEQGAFDGTGNSFYCSFGSTFWFPQNNSSNKEDTPFDPEAITYIVSSGHFKSGKENGQIREYMGGVLLYEGNKKDGKKDGEGTEYDYDGTLKYQGEFKDDLYHGSGTLYDEKGKIIYKGKWKYGDYA